MKLSDSTKQYVWKLFIIWIVLLLVGILDLLFTCITIVKFDAIEANPIASYMLDNYGPCGLFSFKIASHLLMAFVMLSSVIITHIFTWFKILRPAIFYTAILILGINVAAVINNLYIIYIAWHKLWLMN